MRLLSPTMIASHNLPLPDRGIVRVGGTDAESFLQGLITNDIGLLADAPAIFAALLSPQGKILFEFLVVKDVDGFLLDVAASEVADFVKRLTLYKLRAKVAIEDQSSTQQVFANATGYTDPRFAALGERAIAACGSPPTPALPQKGREMGAEFDATVSPVTDRSPSPLWGGARGGGSQDYDARRIALGVPEGGKDYAFGALFPHEAMFDQLNGVSFSKGCYVGQEIVARMQHRGTARSRFLMVTGTGPLPPTGTEILAGTTPLGAMGSSAGTQGLALVRLDRLAGAYAAKQPVTANTVAITFAKPPYATFDVPAP